MKLLGAKTAWVLAALALVAGVDSLAARASAPAAASTNLDDVQLDDEPAPAPAAAPARAPAPKRALAIRTKAPASRKPAAAPDAGLEDVSLDDVSLDAAPASQNATMSKTEKEQLLLLGAADMLEQSKDFAGVVAKLKPKIDTLPRKGLLQLGRAQRALNNSLGEIQAISLVTARAPKDYVAIVLLGDAFLKARRFDDAISSYDSAIAMNKLYRPAYEGKWSYYEMTKETYEARILVQDMIKIFGADGKTASALCRLSNAGDLLEKTEETCRTAIEKDPNNPLNYVYLATNLKDLEKGDAADKEITQAAKRFPASEMVLTTAGDIKTDHKSYAEAYRYYGQAAKYNPFSSKANLGLAKSAFELQKHDEAISAFVRACKLDRKAALDFRQAAIQLKKNGDTKAWTKYQNAIDERCD